MWPKRRTDNRHTLDRLRLEHSAPLKHPPLVVALTCQLLRWSDESGESEESTSLRCSATEVGRECPASRNEQSGGQPYHLGGTLLRQHVLTGSVVRDPERTPRERLRSAVNINSAEGEKLVRPSSICSAATTKDEKSAHF